MKNLYIFNNNYRIVGDPSALILPYHPSNIKQVISLETATEDEIKQLKKNPHDERLLQKIKNIAKIK